jgi:ribonuclease D
MPKDTPHPELYRQLLDWRRLKAEELERAVHEVLPTRSLQELVDRMPVNRTLLRTISGIGKGRAKRFGDDLIGIIRKYCEEKHPAARPKPSKGNTKWISYDLFKSGKTVTEIAAERGLAVSTIEGHLAYFIARGTLDISEFLTKEQIDEIAAFFRERNTDLLSEAKAHFGERFTYGQLRIVIEHMKAVADV